MHDDSGSIDFDWYIWVAFPCNVVGGYFLKMAYAVKDDFVRLLAEKLRQYHIEVWYYEFSLSVGDSLSQKINEGLVKSKFGIAVLSPSFSRKPRAKRELKGLTAKEMVENQNLILPI